VNSLTALYNLDSKAVLPIGGSQLLCFKKIRENPITFGQLEVEVEERRTVLLSGSSAGPPLDVFNLPIG
jgi:hypothetical protein